MQKNWYKPFLPHLIAVAVFLLVAWLFCRPAFEHKVLSQSDLDQWKAMAHNSFEYRDAHGQFPLWTEGMFSGMPAYQIEMPGTAFAPLAFFHNLLTLWLPAPANTFFLGCICFYLLALALRVNPYAGMAGALAYAYATYNPAALVVGHITKIEAIEIMPAFLAGLLLIYEKRYWLGTAALALFTALFIASNHPQINYYGAIIAVFMTLAYAIRWIRARDYRHLVRAAILVAFGAGIGLACNAIPTLITMDYTKASLRSGSALATPGGSVTKTGLSQDYALSYSMYKTEAFELLVPKIYGGGGGSINAMIDQDNSKAIADLQNMPPQAASFLQRYLNFYWGGIGSNTGGPAYAGAIICFLALLGFFVLDSKHKWWILAASILAILMSWGSYFVDFNSLLLKILPGYNKFRAPSVIIAIPNLLLCWMAVMTLDKLFRITPAERKTTWQQYKKGLYLTAGVFGVLLLCYWSFDYTGTEDHELQQIAAGQQGQVQELIRNFLRDLHADRQSIFWSSLVRSFLFVAATAAIGFAWIRGLLKPVLPLILIGALAVIDVLSLDSLYMNGENFQEEEEAQTPFTPSPADQQISKDTGYYRVFDLRNGAGKMITNSATAAYFHRTVGGYSPAKLSIYEDLLENQLEKYPACQPALNMLNTKYLLLPSAGGRGDSVSLNPGALGAAWLVRAITAAGTPRAVMDALNSLDVKDTAIVFTTDAALKPGTPATGDTVYLMRNDNDEMIYRSSTSGERFAVFSEVYYDRGWHAYIDNTEVPIIRTDYALRGLVLPAGQHTIRFVFHPGSYYTGSAIQFTGGILLVILLLGTALWGWRNSGKGQSAKKA
jgi:membrane protein YfhO